MTFTANCTIISHNPAGNYSQLDNRPVRDRNLSVEAKAVLWYLASNSDKWHLVMQNVAEVMNMGINRTRRAVAELRERGLVQGENLRNEAGKYIGWAYKIVLPAEFRDQPSETGQLEDLPSARLSSTRASSTPIQMPIIKLNSDLKKKNKQDLILSTPSNYETYVQVCDEDEDVGISIFSLSEQENNKSVTFTKIDTLDSEAFKVDLCSILKITGIITQAPISGVGKSSAADYIITTNDNLATVSRIVEKPTQTGAERRAARSTKQATQRKATLLEQGQEKGLWQSMAELDAFMTALTAHTVENTRIHSPKSWVMSEVKKAVVDGVSLNWNEFKSTGKVSQANKRPVSSSATSTPLYGNSQAEEFRDWYDWAKKAGLVSYSEGHPQHYAIVVMGDGITLPWRDAKAQFPKC